MKKKKTEVENTSDKKNCKKFTRKDNLAKVEKLQLQKLHIYIA